MFTSDETLARVTDTGRIAHLLIGRIAPITLTPSAELLTSHANDAVSMFAPVESKAHRQNIAGIVGVYFWRLLPPLQWRFVAAELHLGGARLDLVWADPDERILVDEVKTGHSRSLQTPAVRDQVSRYVQLGRTAWGESFVGVRLLSTAAPRLSQLMSPCGHIAPLSSTTHHRSL